jgi:hypothetical protein
MKSPFKFLDSYTKDDREIFFGRNREIGEWFFALKGLYIKEQDNVLLNINKMITSPLRA